MPTCTNKPPCKHTTHLLHSAIHHHDSSEPSNKTSKHTSLCLIVRCVWAVWNGTCATGRNDHCLYVLASGGLQFLIGIVISWCRWWIPFSRFSNLNLTYTHHSCTNKAYVTISICQNNQWLISWKWRKLAVMYRKNTNPHNPRPFLVVRVLFFEDSVSKLHPTCRGKCIVETSKHANFYRTTGTTNPLAL